MALMTRYICQAKRFEAWASIVRVCIGSRALVVVVEETPRIFCARFKGWHIKFYAIKE